MVLLSVLSNILVSLEPYTRGHRAMFAEDFLQVRLANVKVYTDEARLEATNTAAEKVDILRLYAILQTDFLSTGSSSFSSFF